MGDFGQKYSNILDKTESAIDMTVIADERFGFNEIYQFY